MSTALEIIQTLAAIALAMATYYLSLSTKNMAKTSAQAAMAADKQNEQVQLLGKHIETLSSTIKEGNDYLKETRLRELDYARRQVVWEMDKNLSESSRFDNETRHYRVDAWSKFGHLPIFDETETKFVQLLNDLVLPFMSGKTGEQLRKQIGLQGAPHGFSTLQQAEANILGGPVLIQLHKKYDIPPATFQAQEKIK